MKNIKFLFVALATLLVVQSCNRDSSPKIKTNDKNNVTLQFDDTRLADESLLFGHNYTSSSGQNYQFSKINYIISNVILTKADGTEVKYHWNDPNNGAFIVRNGEGISTVHDFVLKDIPAGDYVKVQFGIGVSPEAYLLGQDQQGEFWDKAKDMRWNWKSGYVFVKIEGEYTTTENTQKQFLTHIGNMGKPNDEYPNVYKTVTLDIKGTAKVRGNISPIVHIVSDFSKYLDGKNKIILNADNDNKMTPKAPIVQKAIENISEVFFVHHTHNNPN